VNKLRIAERAVEAYREAAEELTKTDAEIEALEGICAAERKDLEEYRARPRQLRNALGEIHKQAEESGRSLHLSCFRFREIDDVFSRLLARRHDPDGLRWELRSHCPDAITGEGLCEIAGVPAGSSTESVASALLKETPAFQGPHWGGGTPTADAEETIVVIPPLDDGQQDELQRAILRFANDQVSYSVAQADSFIAGANILVIKMFKASYPWDIVPQQYFHRIQSMDRGHFFIDWDGMMKENRPRRIYEELCEHYQLPDSNVEEVER
jgi:hypothetical protein